MARPNEFSRERALEITEGLCAGLSMRTVCSDERLPGASTVYRWLADGEGEDFDWFREQYERARKVQATVLFDRIIEVVGLVISGRLDPKAGRVAIYGLEILASRMHPRKYGRRLDVAADVSVSAGVLVVPESDLSVEEFMALERGDPDPPGPEIVAEQQAVPARSTGGAGVVRA